MPLPSKPNLRWSKVWPNTARQGIEIHGVVSFNDQSIVSGEDERINAESTRAWLQVIHQKHEPAIEVKIVLDHAGYNQAEISRSFANANNLELVFLPPYSSNSKLDWTIVGTIKKTVTHNQSQDICLIFMMRNVLFWPDLKTAARSERIVIS